MALLPTTTDTKVLNTTKVIWKFLDVVDLVKPCVLLRNGLIMIN